MIPSPVPLEPLILICIAVVCLCAFVAFRTGTAAAKGNLHGFLEFGRTPAPAAGQVFVPGREMDEEDLPASEEEAPGGLRVRWRTIGYVSAGGAAAVGIVALLVLAGVTANYPKMYDKSVWTALSEHYGIHSAIPDQGYKAGVAFQGVLDGKSMECTVVPPSVVSCDGKDVPPRG